MSILVLAESVEADFRGEDRRCDEAQGFWYGRPLGSGSARSLARTGIGGDEAKLSD
ncbi:hypothetical protein [Aminobacter sp. HY435]|uniref:hypothetical protein n=1 Tax=Aminobacter sp. HY435 TaxID=2970917 RepID=UPI0022B95EE3|nr:hypothetical protein [Aminobacter sp. HY435]